jgi:hypothetical protein
MVVEVFVNYNGTVPFQSRITLVKKVTELLIKLSADGAGAQEPEFGFAAPWSRSRKQYVPARNNAI